MVAINTLVPDVKLKTAPNEALSMVELRGQNVVLFFYPKDDTPGCTQESIDFRDADAVFKQLNTLVIGISRDSLASHEKFKTKHQLVCPLASDSDESLCNVFDVLKEKNMYGKKVIGIERSTFLIDKMGMVRQVWRKVKVPGHVDEVITAIKSLV